MFVFWKPDLAHDSFCPLVPRTNYPVRAIVRMKPRALSAAVHVPSATHLETRETCANERYELTGQNAAVSLELMPGLRLMKRQASHPEASPDDQGL